MKKELPKAKKTIKSFILDEDAKVIDKTAFKLAITGSLLTLGITMNVDNVNAGVEHSNYLRQADEYNWSDKMPGGDGVKYVTDLSNEGDDSLEYSDSIDGHKLEVDIPPKSVAAAHGNHYNHSDGGGSS